MQRKRPISATLTLAMLILCTSACSTGGSAVTQPLVKSQRSSADCLFYQSERRSIGRRGVQDDCTESDGGQGTGWNTPGGDPGFDFDDPDGDAFYTGEDNYGNPCPDSDAGYGVIGCVTATNSLYYFPIGWTAPPPAINKQVGMPGGPATRGDNCSNTNGLAIGYLVPGARQSSLNGQPLNATNNSATISNQSEVVLSNGGASYVIGYVIGSKGDGYFFVPNVVVGVNIGVLSLSQAAAGVYALPSPNINSPTDVAAMQAAFDSFISKYGGTLQGWLASAFASSTAGGHFQNEPCNWPGLQRFG